MFKSKFFRVSLLASAVCLTACLDDETSSTDSQHLDRALVYEEQGQYQAAAIEYRNAVKKSGDAVDARVRYATMLNTIGQNSSAAELLTQVAYADVEESMKGKYADALLAAYLGMGKYYSAQKFLSAELASTADAYRIEQAQVHLGQGQLNKALRSINTAIKQEDSDEAKAILAQILFEKGDTVKAESLVSKIPDTSDFYNRAQIIQAGIQIFENDLTGAESTLTKLLVRMPSTDSMLPEKATVLERMSYVLTRLGRPTEAYSYSKLLADAFPGANEAMDQYKSAVEAFKSKDFEKAKSVLNELLLSQPHHPHAKQLMGIIAYFEGDQASAAAYFDDSVDPELSSNLTNEIYAATSLQMNEPKKVLEILESQVETTDSSSILVLYGVAAISDGKVVEGEAALKRAIEVSAKDIRPRLALATFYQSRNPARLEEALSQLESAYLLEPKNLKVLGSLTRYHLAHSGEAKAESFVKQVLATYPKDFSTNLIAGFYSTTKGELAEALSFFDKAIGFKTDKDNYAQALMAKARTEGLLEKHAEAEKTFRSLVEAFPAIGAGYQGLFVSIASQGDVKKAEEALLALAANEENVEAYFVLIANAARSGEFTLARERLDAARKQLPESERLDQAEVAIAEAAAARSMGERNYAEARKEINLLVDLDPQRIAPLGMLTTLELTEGNYDEAANRIGDIEALDPSHPAVPVLRGDLALALNEYESALNLYRNAWEKAPSSATGDKVYRALSKLKRSDEQSAFLDEWVEKLPNATQPLVAKAMTAQSSGQMKSAESTYKQVLERQPNNAIALNNLGWMYFERGDQESLNLLARAVQVAPNSAPILDSYGWALYKFGQKEKALPYLEKAHLNAPDNAEIKAHLDEAKGG